MSERQLTKKKAITVIFLSPLMIAGVIARVLWIALAAGWDGGSDLVKWWTREPQEDQP